MILTLEQIEGRQEHTRSLHDARFKIIRIIASYRGEDGFEYRKAFEGKTMPVVPQMGTHSELNKLAIQY